MYSDFLVDNVFNVNTTLVNSNVNINSLSFSVGSNVVINSTGVFVEGTINTYSFNSNTINSYDVNTSIIHVPESLYVNSTFVTLNTAIPISISGSVGSPGQFLTTNGINGVIWSSPDPYILNTANAWIWTNTHTFTLNMQVDGNSNASSFTAANSSSVAISNSQGITLRNTLASPTDYFIANTASIYLGPATQIGAFNSQVKLSNVHISNVTGIHAYGNLVVYPAIGSVTPNFVVNGAGVHITSGTSFIANGTPGLSGQVLVTDGIQPYWQSVDSVVNTFAQYSWSNTQAFLSNVSFSGTSVYYNVTNVDIQTTGLTISGNTNINGSLTVNSSSIQISPSTALLANSTIGSAGSALLTNGSSVYWGYVTVNTSAQYIWSNSHTFTGGVSLSGNTTIRGTFSDSDANYITQNITSAPTIQIDFTAGGISYLTLNQNVVIQNPNPVFKRINSYVIHLIQDGAGNHTVTWGTDFKWPAGIAPILSTAPGSRDIISFIGDGTYYYGTFIPDVR